MKRALVFWGITCAAALGCGEVLDIHDRVLRTTGGGGEGAQGGEQSGGGGVGGIAAGGEGGVGGTVELCVADDCPGTSTQCSMKTCINNMCGLAITPTFTPCQDDGGRYCDGTGNCVECVNDQDTPCPSSGVCQSFACYSAGCADTVLNNGETDTDCGGPNCGPCDNGAMCNVGSDCISTLCATGFCDACNAHEDCATTQYCDLLSGHCKAKLPFNTACTSNDQCETGCCPLGFPVCWLMTSCE